MKLISTCILHLPLYLFWVFCSCFGFFLVFMLAVFLWCLGISLAKLDHLLPNWHRREMKLCFLGCMLYAGLILECGLLLFSFVTLKVLHVLRILHLSSGSGWNRKNFFGVAVLTLLLDIRLWESFDKELLHLSNRRDRIVILASCEHLGHTFSWFGGVGVSIILHEVFRTWPF